MPVKMLPGEHSLIPNPEQDYIVFVKFYESTEIICFIFVVSVKIINKNSAKWKVLFRPCLGYNFSESIIYTTKFDISFKQTTLSSVFKFV